MRKRLMSWRTSACGIAFWHVAWHAASANDTTTSVLCGAVGSLLVLVTDEEAISILKRLIGR